MVRPLPQADGYLLAFSVTDSASFEALSSLLPRLPFAAPCLPVATKADLGECVSHCEGDRCVSYLSLKCLSDNNIYDTMMD